MGLEVNDKQVGFRDKLKKINGITMVNDLEPHSNHTW